MYFLETGSHDPYYNLAFEEYILLNKTYGQWLLLWQNDKTVVVGQNQNTFAEIDPVFVKENGISVVRRSTGGGAVYHDLGNINYSFISDTDDADRMTIERFSRPVCIALRELGVPAELSGRNDILVEGKKISGAAERVYKNRILHHGTLLFNSDLEMISKALRADPLKFSSKSIKSVRSRVSNIAPYLPQGTSLGQFYQTLKEKLSAGEAVIAGLDAEELGEINRLADEKYRSWDWIYGRTPKSNMQARRRFDGGILEVNLSVNNGLIREVCFRGDFLSTTPVQAAVDALEGVRFDTQEVRDALSPLEIRRLFGDISLDEIVKTIFEASED